MQDLSAFQTIQKALLELPQGCIFPGLSLYSSYYSDSDLKGFFLEVLHPSTNLIDVIIGYVPGDSLCSFVLALTAKMEILRFAKPIFQGHHFSRIKLWEKNILEPNEIMELIQLELQNLLLDLRVPLHLFYGRFNLEYNTLTYVDCGNIQAIYYNAETDQTLLLTHQEPPLGQFQSYSSFKSTQISISIGDFFLFYSNNFISNHREEKSFDREIKKLLKTHKNNQLPSLLEQIRNLFSKVRDSSNPNSGELFATLLKMTEDRQAFSPKYATAKFCSDFSQLEAVREFVRRVCSKAPYNDEELSLHMQLVINEIFCNIVKHSYQGQIKGEILIECQLADDGIYFTLSDKGEPFNPSEINYPDLTGTQEDGFGFFIIQQLTDHISYKSKTHTHEWNHLRIFKRYISEEEQMEFSHQIQGNVLVITPKGENLDAKNAPAFKEGVLNLIRSSKLSKLVFDLHNLQFIDSSGLGTFLSVQRTLNTQGGTLKLAHLNKPIRTMFEIVSMHRIFDIFNTTEEAVNSFN